MCIMLISLLGRLTRFIRLKSENPETKDLKFHINDYATDIFTQKVSSDQIGCQHSTLLEMLLNCYGQENEFCPYHMSIRKLQGETTRPDRRPETIRMRTLTSDKSVGQRGSETI